MAEDLDDGEFWLPSQFLTDDDILMDFDFDLDLNFESSPSKPQPGLGLSSSSGRVDHLHSSASNSDLDFTSGSTETESDEEDILLTGLTHQMARSNLQDSSCPVHSKGTVLSSSPQSTLCGCMCHQSSSRESQSGPISPPQPPQQDEKENNATLDLLHKAAGEVARLKSKTEKSNGTGFFDCSQKGVLYPSPLRNPDHFPPVFFQPHFHHFRPQMMWAPPNGVQYVQPKPPQQPPPQNRATKNNTKKNGNNKNTAAADNNNNNRPLGLPPSAWPPLQVQPPNPPPSMPPPPMFVGPKRECVGTGVFLPRRVTTATENRKKSDGNTTKTKSEKGSQKQSHSSSQSQSNHRRNARTTSSTVNHNDIQLPQEWTY